MSDQKGSYSKSSLIIFLFAIHFIRISVQQTSIRLLTSTANCTPHNRLRNLRSIGFLGGTQEICSDAEQVSDISQVKFPRRFSHITRPWMRTDVKPKLYKSSNLQYNWNWMKSLLVRGIENRKISVEDVLTKLESSGCFFLPWGGSVRDAVLGRNPSDIDGEVTCDAFKVRDVCLKHFGATNCGNPPLNNFTRMVIGNPNSPARRNELTADPMDLAQWNSTFNVPPTMWEYTANALGLYDNQMGSVYLIDMTGQGLKDVCDRRIDIPTAKENWDKWFDGDIMKLLRYYKLRIHGFIPASENVTKFIVDRVKHFFSVRKMQKFYCKYVADGTFVWRNRSNRDQSSYGSRFTSSCIIAPVDENTLSDEKTMAAILEEDFGFFYKDEMLRAINTMEMRILASDQKQSIQATQEEEKLRDSGAELQKSTMPEPEEMITLPIFDIEETTTQTQFFTNKWHEIFIPVTTADPINIAVVKPADEMADVSSRVLRGQRNDITVESDVQRGHIGHFKVVAHGSEIVSKALRPAAGLLRLLPSITIILFIS